MRTVIVLERVAAMRWEARVEESGDPRLEGLRGTSSTETAALRALVDEMNSQSLRWGGYDVADEIERRD